MALFISFLLTIQGMQMKIAGGLRTITCDRRFDWRETCSKCLMKIQWNW